MSCHCSGICCEKARTPQPLHPSPLCRHWQLYSAGSRQLGGSLLWLQPQGHGVSVLHVTLCRNGLRMCGGTQEGVGGAGGDKLLIPNGLLAFPAARGWSYHAGSWQAVC